MKLLSNALLDQAETSGVTFFAQRATPDLSEDAPPVGVYPYAVSSLALFGYPDDNLLYQLLRWEVDFWGYNDAAAVWDAVTDVDEVMRGWSVQDTSSIGTSTPLERESVQPIEEPLDDKMIRVRVVYTGYYVSRAVAAYL